MHYHTIRSTILHYTVQYGLYYTVYTLLLVLREGGDNDNRGSFDSAHFHKFKLAIALFIYRH